MTSTHQARARRLLGGTTAALLASMIAVTLAPTAAHGAPAPKRLVSTDSSLGCGSAEVTKTLATGSAWRMCVRVHDYKGLVIENLQFRPATGGREYEGWMPVLDSLALAQLNVPYDTGGPSYDDVTANGLGGAQLLSQTTATCGGTTVATDQTYISGNQVLGRIVPGICVTEKTDGLGFHAVDDSAAGGERYTQESHALEVSSISRVGWYEYQQKVMLTDLGTIRVGLGATGDIGQDTLFFPTDPSVGWQVGARTGETPSADAGAASHWHNAIYRVDFGLDAGPQQVEQWDYDQPSPASIQLNGAPTTRTSAFAAPSSTSRETWWRVLNPASLNPDGHPRSYEIVNDSIQDSHQPATDPKVSFTNSKACQEYAWDNLNAACPGEDIAHYIATDTDPLTDPVAWVNVGFHHIVRDEDQSPMPIHWQEFSLVPRDLTAQQATTPIERSCINGGPLTPGGSCAAVNTVPPKVTASPGAIRAGSLLSVDEGTWKSARAPLGFQRIWLRDGQPISSSGVTALVGSMTGQTYTVTPADEGHKLSVQVSASGAGIIPGVATSNVLTVPRAAVVAPPKPSAPSIPRVKARVRATITYRGTKAIVKITVRGTRGTAGGRLAITGRGWKRTKQLTTGTATFRLPAKTVRKSAKVRITYSGSRAYKPSSTSIKVKRTIKR